MTASVIDWINSGFKGNPSFLQNPEAFFTNVIDETSSVFLSDKGPLSVLCDQFRIDIQTDLRLNPTGGYGGINNNYGCTLSRVVDNFKNNGVDVNIDAFQRGDFSQGGWPMFIETFSKPQNNIYGAKLNAEEGLKLSIEKKKQAYEKELVQSRGFLGIRDCKPVDPMGGSVAFDYETGEPFMDDEGNYMNWEGETEDCTTTTPGSAVADALQKNLNVPADELLLADSINSVINALVNQMINQVITKGVAALSSGGGGSYTQKIKDKSLDGSNIKALQQNVQKSAETVARTFAYSKADYEQAITIVSSSKNNMLNALACYQNTIPATSNDGGTSQQRIEEREGEINSIIVEEMDPLLNKFNQKISDIEKEVERASQIGNSATSSADYLDKANSEFRELVDNGVRGTEYSETDLENARIQADIWNKMSEDYLRDCRRGIWF
jgi:hypothetical protein